MPDLVLRDIHVQAAPDWWPPAPGWWWLAGVLLLAMAGAGIVMWRRARRQRLWLRMFDEAVDAASDMPGRIAAMSALLRRAARRVQSDADRLQGQAWLAFLDDGATPSGFTDGPGAALRDGAFRRELADLDIDALRDLARARFLSLMAAGR